MDPVVQKLVRRLVFRPESLSRNRNFFLFKDPAAKNARRVAAFIRSVIDDLLVTTDDNVRVQTQGEGVSVTILDPSTQLRRTASLSVAEWKIVLEHPDLRGRFPEPQRT